MDAAELPPLESCGFIRVPADPGTTEPLWLPCDSCGKSDHFWVDEGQVRCRCGATYTHAKRPDGREIGVEALTFVPWKEGPMNLADTEVDPMRLTLVVVGALALVGAVGIGVYWALG